jgi:hypothetical protein
VSVLAARAGAQLLTSPDYPHRLLMLLEAVALNIKIGFVLGSFFDKYIVIKYLRQDGAISFFMLVTLSRRPVLSVASSNPGEKAALGFVPDFSPRACHPGYDPNFSYAGKTLNSEDCNPPRDVEAEKARPTRLRVRSISFLPSSRVLSARMSDGCEGRVSPLLGSLLMVKIGAPPDSGSKLTGPIWLPARMHDHNLFPVLAVPQIKSLT